MAIRLGHMVSGWVLLLVLAMLPGSDVSRVEMLWTLHTTSLQNETSNLKPQTSFACRSLARWQETSNFKPQTSNSIVVASARFSAYLPLLEGKRIGLIVNHSSLVDTVHLVDALLARGVEVRKIFAPEHGFRGTADAGAKIDDDIDARTGLPVVSLYGSKRKPAPADLAGLDVLVFDIQDVGVRFYTYISTMSYAMEAAAENGLSFVVLDRPNPNGHVVDGPVMQSGCTSFIGLHEGVPIAHGMTVGEYARMVNGEGWLKGGIRVDLTVVPLTGWTHDMPYELPVRPSPNLPNMRSIYLYPTLCLFEATALSVGRGTEAPFQWVGHPDYPEGTVRIPKSMPGAGSPKLEGKACKGPDFTHLSDAEARELAHIQVEWLLEAYQNFPQQNKFFESHFHRLAGNRELESQIKAGLTPLEIRITWQEGLEQFRTVRAKYLLYE